MGHLTTWKIIYSTVPLSVANLPHNDYYICSGPFLWIPDSGQHSMPPTNHLWGVLLVHTLYLSSSFLLRLVPLHNSAATSPLIHSIKPTICTTSVLSLATLWALQHFRRLLLQVKSACVLTLHWLRSPGSVPVILRQNGSRHITSEPSKCRKCKRGEQYQKIHAGEISKLKAGEPLLLM